MLRRLTIQNIVLIEQVELHLHAGLTVLTGETGAGKSILLDALGLALGNRAEARLVRAGAAQGSVIAEFTLPKTVHTLLEEAAISIEDDTLLIRRVITADGKSKAFINDTPVSLQLLQTIAEQLVEVHGQHDQRGLLMPANHMQALDDYAASHPQREKVAQHYTAWQQSTQALQQLQQSMAQAQQEQDYLQHVLKELRSLNVKLGEEDTLSQQRSLLQHSAKLRDALMEALGNLVEKSDALNGIRTAERILLRVPHEAQAQLQPALESLDKAGSELQEAQAQIEQVLEQFDQGGLSLETLEDRLFAIRGAARKYQMQPDELPAYAESIALKLTSLDQQDALLKELEQQVDSHQQHYQQAAQKLSDARKKAAKKLEAAIAKELPPLKMENAAFAVEIVTQEEAGWGPHGLDKIQFLIRTNPGAPFGALSKVASGGELSRLMLALKVVLSDAYATPTMIFDEIDTGIGGATADAVGKRLAQLAERVQVLCVTHQPQVACYGGHHFHIAKQQQQASTVTQVSSLNDNARTEELARMLAGETITEEARAAAQQLLKRA